MLFNSYSFMFVFVPLVLALHWLALRISHRAGIAALALASLIFYGWWDIRFLPLLLTSILANFLLGRRIQDAPQSSRKIWLVFGLILNLSVLFFFKYFNFFLSVAGDLGLGRFDAFAIILPIGISFITFQKIAYLVDVYEGKSNRYSLLDFSLFVSFFPQLIAGPIVHHSQIVPQFAVMNEDRANMLAKGLSIFAVGLFKKVVIADNLAQFASPVFRAADAGLQVSTLEAWGGVLAYTFQIYYDFSGYCDMAIGLALLFGIRLPVNFDSPYKAASIIDFWRRWHMTLSRFLRDYLYVRLGGNRLGRVRRYMNLMITMLLGGLWHGAGWGFIIWGALHGFYLAVNHLFRDATGRSKPASPSIVRSLICGALTFLAVVNAWVFFRATTIEGALTLLGSMSGLSGITVPQFYSEYLGGHGQTLQSFGLSFAGPGHVQPRDWALTGLPLVIAAGALAWLVPNTNQIFRLIEPSPAATMSTYSRLFQWRPSAIWLAAMITIFGTAILFASAISEFLYFQF
jgi:alginate O-acetyltransferase complex protein AlgI